MVLTSWRHRLSSSSFIVTIQSLHRVSAPFNLVVTDLGCQPQCSVRPFLATGSGYKVKPSKYSKSIQLEIEGSSFVLLERGVGGGEEGVFSFR